MKKNVTIRAYVVANIVNVTTLTTDISLIFILNRQ